MQHWKGEPCPIPAFPGCICKVYHEQRKIETLFVNLFQFLYSGLQFTGNVINLASSSGDLRQDMVTLRGNPGEIRYSDVRKWTFETWQL